MYQTVGQDAIELVAEALAVPLYRKVITGTAIEQSSEYGSRDAVASKGVNGDETEDLHELLKHVKARNTYCAAEITDSNYLVEPTSRCRRRLCRCYSLKLSKSQG